MIGIGIDIGIGNGNNLIPLGNTFSQIVSSMNKIYDLQFGTAAPDAGATRIQNATELGNLFEPLQNGTESFVINREMQRYPVNFADNPECFVFGTDSLELRAVAQASLPAGITTASPTADVTYSRTVNLASAAGLKVGQVVGFGAESFANAHSLYTLSVASAVAGDVLTLTISHNKNAAQGGFDPISIVSFTSAGADDTALANDMVSKINANSTLQSFNITAFKMPTVPGGFAFTAPRNSLAEVDDFGPDGKASYTWLTRSFSRTGSATVLNPQSIFGTTYIVAISGNTLTLSNPVTLTTSSVITFNPTRMLEVRTTGGNTVYQTADASGLTVGQLCQFAYQDSNLRRITAVDTVSNPNTFTLSNSVFMQAGHFITVYPAFSAITTAATVSGTVLTFASVPAGVAAGHQFYNYFASNNAGDIKVVSKTATTVTLDTVVNVSSGDTIFFTQPIKSGQFWSKWNIMPGADNRTIVAMEMIAKAPDSSNLGAWPAFWLYTDTQDPNPIGAVLPSSEIDMLDTFNYWNNSTNNNVVMNSPLPNTYLKNNPFMATTSLTGNNLGSQERKIGVIWTESLVYFYVDDVLVSARKSRWNKYKRAQLGVNLACGSISTSLNSNGLFPIENSQFPFKYAIKKLKVYSTPSSTPPL